MKKLVLFFVAIFIAINTFAVTDILDAINSKKISVKVSYSRLGKAGIHLTITNLSIEQLTIKVKPGVIFTPSNEGEQTLMNVEEALIAIAPQKNASKDVGGYCIMLHKAAPSLTESFKIDIVKQANLLSFLSFIKTTKVSEGNYQSAIWAITDNEDIASIEPISDGDTKLREHISTLTGRKNPWYSKPQTITANPGQMIVRKSVAIEGTLSVSTTTTYDVFVSVENSKGEVKMKLEPMTLDKNSDNSFNFKVSASRWEVGNYKVVIRKVSDNKEVKRFDFTV